ncbi:axonemal dynein light chain domain-containing protein 1 isoform X2 [Stegostoma tigrinum]|uniref:axonemal dynein light chain domain-containing protein 1 isoform X2 n=1 Tax=Stegostoma tigrinum TaxID=3053191 RepID=UPI0028706BE1|nr:axonemal dynein light chain domain-containing protein 1 isoform X2 [Stegostoma tigrinum]
MCDSFGDIPSDDVLPAMPKPDEDSAKLSSNVCKYLKELPESSPTSEQMLNMCACFGDGKKDSESDNPHTDICTPLKEQTELPKLKDNPRVIDQRPPTSLQNDFIPEEILLALTTVTNTSCRDKSIRPQSKNKPQKDHKVHGIRPTDRVWHHPIRRTKFKYLIDQPVQLARAGRDISFLCDAVYSKCSEEPLPPVSVTMDKSAVRAHREKQPVTKQLDVAESLIPDEYHIVKNKGVLGLEYYEDKYTTLLQDHEKKLRVFPSMKPSGRVEAIQLSQVMDTMLEKVGFNEDNEKQHKGETQMHHLLDLVKKEQDIYNIVFHELIRQISVDCVERGELLAKIRERYVNLLDYIPRHLNNMHNEIMMQRVLDKQLIVELFTFQNAVEKLNSELGELRERDHKVAKTVEKTQTDLSDALIDAQKNANMLDEYHQLYELQRKRLISQVNSLTQEKDWWSEAAYSLALKVIEEQNLKLVHDLQISEKLWVKVAQHFATVLGTKDAEDQSKLQKITAQWRKLMNKFSKIVEAAENASYEKREQILSGFKKWHKYFSDKISSPLGIKSIPGEMLYLLRSDMKYFHEMITQDYTRYEGSLFLTAQEDLLAIEQLQHEWTDLTITLFERHRWSDNDKMPEEAKMEELNNSVRALSQHYSAMLTGENGTAWYIMKLQDQLEPYRVKFDYAKMEDVGSIEFDLLKLHEQLPTLIKLLEDAMNLAAPSPPEEEKKNKKHSVSHHLGEVTQKMQDWLLELFKMIIHMDTKLTKQIVIVQSAMSHMLVSLLLSMVHDPIANIKKKYFKHLAYPDSPAKLEEKALMVASQLNILSTQMYSWCRDIVEELVKNRTAMHLEDPDNELKELEKLKVEGTEWINICEILLSEIKQQPVQLLSSREDDIQSQINLTRDLCSACLRGSATEILGMADSDLSLLIPGETETDDGPRTIASFQKLSEIDKSESGTQAVHIVNDTNVTKESLPLSKSRSPRPTKGTKDIEDQSPGMDEGQSVHSHEKSILKFIGDDTNIHERDLKETPVPMLKTGFEAVVPTNPKSKKAFEALTAMGILQQQLVETEQRAMFAEERATSLDESLHEALNKIKDLTLQLKSVESKNQIPQPVKSPLPTRTVSARSVVKVATPASAKTKSSKSSKTKPKK